MIATGNPVVRYLVTIDGIGYVMESGRSVERLMGAVRDAVREGAEWVAVPVSSGHKRVLVTANSTAWAEQWSEPDEPDAALSALPVFPAFDDFREHA